MYNGVGWFLSTIMFLYILNLPLKYIFARIKKIFKRDSILLLLAVLMFIFEIMYSFFMRNTNIEWTQYILPISRIAEYVCGIALGYYIRSLDLDNKNDIKWKSVFTAMEIIVLAVWIINIYLPMADWQFRVVHWMLPNCLLVCAFGIGKGIISDIFKIDFLRYLGDISFECFLIHQIFIYVYTALSGVRDVSRLGNCFSFIFCLLGTVAIAALVSKKKIKGDCKKYTIDWF